MLSRSFIVCIISAACMPLMADAFITIHSTVKSISVRRITSNSYATPSRDTSCLHATSGSGFGSSKKKKSRRYVEENGGGPTATTELFELQELRAQLQTMLKEDLQYQTLSTEKREELTKYVSAVVAKSQSPIDFSGKIDKMGTAKFVAGVESKSWRMIFSTDPNGGEEGDNGGAELPYGSTVVMRIGEFMGCEGNMDYVLKFSKQIMGLRELVAKSTCSVDIGPVNPGVFAFQYQDIKTNVFGMSNLPVGFFGLLKGRTTYIDTVWFDGDRWIERNYLENGGVVYNVYVRDESDE